MKIYRIISEVNKFQSLALNDESLWQTGQFTFDCVAKNKNWIPPLAYILNPKHRKGDFPYLCPGAIVCNKKANNILFDFFEMSGEILTLKNENQEFYILNILDCINALNQEGTVWKYSKRSGAKIGIEKYSFHPNRIPEPPLFKIPETSKSEILTYSGIKDPEDEFITAYNKSGLLGLLFEELWSY